MICETGQGNHAPNTLPTNHAPEAPTRSRLKSFSDGVIAVIITIMVLEFKLPRESGPKAFISDVGPTLAVYLLSFTYTGIYWINHHHLVNRADQCETAEASFGCVCRRSTEGDMAALARSPPG